MAKRVPMNTVNRFDYNLAMCADPQAYVQLEDTSWIRAGDLTLLWRPRKAR